MPLQSQHGYSLVELVIAVSLLALAAASVAPDPRAHDVTMAQAAAAHYAGAIAFARTEALRTARVHGVSIDAAAATLRVFDPAMTESTPEAGHTVLDPRSKRPVRLEAGQGGIASRVRLDTGPAPFRYAGAGQRTAVLFDRYGRPHWRDSSASEVEHLARGAFEVRVGASAVAVRLDPVTGLVRAW